MAALIRLRPLDAGDNRASFDCGRESLNQWLQRHAWNNQKSGLTRTNVIVDLASDGIAGYVSLATCQIERAWLTKGQQRNRPQTIPAVLLAQLAVDQRYQGRGYAQSLMHFALTTSVRLSREIGCFCVLTHPLDDAVRAFYRAFGFEDLPFDPARSMAVRIVDLIHNGLGQE
jgi:GNAT superfamily N-acetyltransferase